MLVRKLWLEYIITLQCILLVTYILWTGIMHKNGTYLYTLYVTIKQRAYIFLKIIPARCTKFSNLFLERNSTCFRQFLCPSSGVFQVYTQQWYMLHRFDDCLLSSCQQTCMTHTIAVRTLKNSWWWTEELSETCRVSFQE